MVKEERRYSRQRIKKTGARIFWHLDDEYIGETTRFHQMALSPAPGKHFITLVDDAGERITHQFEVLENTADDKR